MLGVWGSKGDKGNASQVVPLVPLEEKEEIGIHRDVSRKLNMTNGGAVLTAHINECD